MTEAEIKELIEFAYKNGWMDGICYPSTEKLNDKINDIYTRYQNDILDSKSLPSVTPQKIGRWIFVDKAKEHGHCSECDYGNVDLLDGRPHNYCPDCGAKMEVEE